LQNEEAVTLQGKIGRHTGVGEGTLRQDPLHGLDVDAETDLTAIGSTSDQGLTEGVFKRHTAALETDGIGVGNVVADDREVHAVGAKTTEPIEHRCEQTGHVLLPAP
jgi:hypothetical protein